MKNYVLLYDNISLISSYDEKCLRQNCRENQNTHFMFNNFFENRAVCEIMWENMIESVRPQITVLRMRIACRYLRLQTHIVRICNTYCFFTATNFARTLLNVTLYVHCIFCYVLPKDEV